MAGLDDARTPVSEVIDRLMIEIARLSAELSKALSDAVYVPMSEIQRREYDVKSDERKRLVEELAQLQRLQQQRSQGQLTVIEPPAASPDAPLPNVTQLPKDAA